MSRPIFVFGSNLLGIHGAGAALHARLAYGAEHGKGEGRTGHAYAIPTKCSPRKVRSLEEISASVRTFIAYAGAHPELTFEVTRVGCGLAGYSDAQIAPLFRHAPANCALPSGWR